MSDKDEAAKIPVGIVSTACSTRHPFETSDKSCEFIQTKATLQVKQ